MRTSEAFIPNQFASTSDLQEKHSVFSLRGSGASAVASRARRLATGVMLLACLAAPQFALAQNSASAPDAPTASPQKLPTVVTTVVVHGTADEVYEPGSASLGGFEQAPLAETPRSGTVVTRSLLDDQQARLLSDVTRNDASIGEDYAPVGYYQDFQIRGFPIDLATGLKINGLTIAGEQLVPLENKESVEFLKGLAGLEAGVTSPGGLINYVTKRPAVVRTLELATDQRGTIFGHLDLGGFLGSHKQFGFRTNVGAENIHSYVNDADGSREFGTFAGDWKINAKTTLRGDFEYQHQVQRSVGGYQLLGGTTIPIDVNPSTMLGEQSWAKPNTFDVFNTSIRLERTLTDKWRGYVTAGKSRSLIDDNIAYPYGCYYVAACNTGAAPEPWFFSPAGDYDVYDYRSPGELRIDDQFVGLLQGRQTTDPLTHNLSIGTSLLRRSVALPTAVYDYVGTDNIHQPLQQFSSSPLTPGPVTLQEDSHQYAVLIEDRVELPWRITLSAGGQIDTLHDHNYSQTDPVTLATYLKVTDKTRWLPQYSVMYRPMGKMMVYANYGVALSLGLQAPFWAVNSSEFLNPFFTRQAEIGAKYTVNQRLLVSADVFRMRAPFFYPKPEDSGMMFVGEGHETHRGLEFSAQGKATSWLRMTASAAAISAISDGTGTPAFDNKQVLNQPRFRATLSADVLVPHVPGLAILPSWNYSGRKAATRDDSVSVDGYNLLNMGLRYTATHGEMSRVTFRLFADNITNKRYWKDTGANYGDTYLHVGAPTTVRLSTQFSF
jgi:iron complex outermembrane recepter protein